MQRIVTLTLLLAVSVGPAASLAPPPPQTFTVVHFAGTAGGDGYDDGSGNAAAFCTPTGAAVDAAGNIYVSDTFGHTIRRVSPAGAVTTFAGRAGAPGNADGVGGTAAFNAPQGICTDAMGNLYTPDSLNNTIRKITPAGVVTTLAGAPGVVGSADGTGPGASFSLPQGITVDSMGNLYLADSQNETVRKITPLGVVSTLAGTAGTPGPSDLPPGQFDFAFAGACAATPSGDVFVSDSGNFTIRKVTPTGAVSTIAGTAGVEGWMDASGTTAQFDYPDRIVYDGVSGSFYVADYGSNTIRKVSTAGDVTTVAGLAYAFGHDNGTGPAALFNEPDGLAVDASGNVYICDSGASTLRKMVPAGAVGTVSTLAGAPGDLGSADLNGDQALFYFPQHIALGPMGYLYVADQGNSTIRKISPAGDVTTLAGLAGAPGNGNGNGSMARFNAPAGIAVDASGNVFVADALNNKIRMITPAGDVSNYAGLGSLGSDDGAALTTARFRRPRGVAIDSMGNLYVADTSNHTIRKIDTMGMVSTFAGLALTPGTTDANGTSARFNTPWDVAVDTADNVYVADSVNQVIRKITPSRDVTTWAGVAGVAGSSDGIGAAALFNAPRGVTVDSSGDVWVADFRNRTIRRITPAGPFGSATTVLGAPHAIGTTDGTGGDARFSGPTGIAVADPNLGPIYVSDANGKNIRVAGPGLPDVATIDAASGPVGTLRQLGSSPVVTTATSWQWKLVRRPTGSTSDLSAANVRNPTFTPDVPELFIFRLTAMDLTGTKSITTVSLQACPLGPDGVPPAVSVPAPVTVTQTICSP